MLPSTVGVLRGPLPRSSFLMSPSLVRQTSFPVFGSRQRRTEASPSGLSLVAFSVPRISNLPPTTAGLPYPAPSLSVLKSNFGPSAGHCFNRPVQDELPSRL